MIKVTQDGKTEYVKQTSDYTDEELLAYQLIELKKLRDNYSDEIPGEIAHSTSENRDYKVRTSWWGQLNMRVKALDSRKLIRLRTIQQYSRVIATHVYDQEQNQGLTTKEHIFAANCIIGLILSELELELLDRQI